MRLFRLFFVLLLGFLLLIVALWQIPEPNNTTGFQHPKYETMIKSGENQINNPHVKWLGFGFGLFTVGVLCFCLFIAARKDGKLGSVKYWLIFGTIVYFTVYCLMILSYWNYVEGNNTESYFGYFPAPTAWMMYAMFFAPLIFVFTYVFGFNKWILTEEDLARFHEIRNS